MANGSKHTTTRRGLWQCAWPELWLVAALLLGCTPPPPRRPPTFPVASGTVAFHADTQVDYRYYFDRNAMRDSCVLGRNLLALTKSGNVLSFDIESLELQVQRVRANAATAIGDDGEGNLLLGFENGTIERVSVGSFVETPVARLDTQIRYVGNFTRPGETQKELIAAFCDQEDSELGYPTVVNLSTGDRYRFDAQVQYDKAPPTQVFHLDRRGRLWLISDFDAFGGRVGFVDLNTGKMTCRDLGIMNFVSGIMTHREAGGLGLCELPDDRILLCGGDRGPYVQELWRSPESEASYPTIPYTQNDDPNSIPHSPRFPISHIIPSNTQDEALVFSGSELFGADLALENWRYLGRLDSKSSDRRFPSAVHRITADLSRVVMSTQRHGICELRRGDFRAHTVTNEFDLPWPGRLVAIDGNVTVLQTLPWYLYSHLPRVIAPHGSLELRVNPDRVVLRNEESWDEYRVFHHVNGPHDSYLTVANTNRSAFAVTMWRHGQGDVLAFSNESLRTVERCFQTRDAVLWHFDYISLSRFEEGEWQTVQCEDTRWSACDALNPAGPPWLLYEYVEQSLRRFNFNIANRTASFRDVPVLDSNGRKLDVRDAVWLDASDSGILATADGLRSIDGESFSPRPFSVPFAEKNVRALCVDGCGRLWVQADALWVSDPAREKFVRVDFAAVLDTRGTVDMVADPVHDSSVWLALGERGVLQLTLQSKH